MIGEVKMEIKKLVVERMSGKGLRNVTARARDTDEYLVWIQKVDHNAAHSVNCGVDVEFKKRIL